MDWYPARCKAKVWGGWRHYQCTRNIWKDGYCKQHHPDTVEEKEKQSTWYRLQEAEKEIARLKARIAELESKEPL